jgi:3-polyprenyl-4-hydroxybenzoate decarboxylase
MSRQRLIIGVSDLLAQTAGKILDQFAIGHTLFRRWNGTSPALNDGTALRV